MKILFICNQNQHRSVTAEELFRDRFETRSAGLYNEHPVEKIDLEWAETIIVMEDFQRELIGKRFPETYLKKRIVSLNIPDIYQYNQPELKQILEERMKDALPGLASRRDPTRTAGLSS